MTVRLAVIGDSISAGFSPSTYGWPKALAALNAGEDFGVKNVAHSGDKIAAAQLLFDSEVVGRGHTHLALLIGTNNLPDLTPAATLWAATKTMVDAARADTSGRAGGMIVFLLDLLPRGTGAAYSAGLESIRLAYNAAQAAYANGTTIISVGTDVPMRQPASSPPRLADIYGGATDGLHPDNAGQVQLANLVQSAAVAAAAW